LRGLGAQLELAQLLTLRRPSDRHEAQQNNQGSPDD
jgi:hypothetical protein